MVLLFILACIVFILALSLISILSAVVIRAGGARPIISSGPAVGQPDECLTCQKFWSRTQALSWLKPSHEQIPKHRCLFFSFSHCVSAR